jgi:hypothetical protein
MNGQRIDVRNAEEYRPIGPYSDKPVQYLIQPGLGVQRVYYLLYISQVPDRKSFENLRIPTQLSIKLWNAPLVFSNIIENT